nr:MAG TPA: hypothetical protein [Caudoviricetes sp.]
MFTVIVQISGLKDMVFFNLNRVQAEEKCAEYEQFGAYTQIIDERF